VHAIEEPGPEWDEEDGRESFDDLCEGDGLGVAEGEVVFESDDEDGCDGDVGGAEDELSGHESAVVVVLSEDGDHGAGASAVAVVG